MLLFIFTHLKLYAHKPDRKARIQAFPNILQGLLLVCNKFLKLSQKHMYNYWRSKVPVTLEFLVFQHQSQINRAPEETYEIGTKAFV